MRIREFISVSHTDESIFVFARPYILAFLPWLTIGICLVLAGVFFATFVPSAFPELVSNPYDYNIYVVIVSAYFLLIIPFFTVGFIDYYYDLLIVTDRRMLDIDQNSLFSRNISELALEQVEDVSSPTTGILQTLFDYGDVVVQTAGAKEKFTFKGVARPRQITNIILDLADQAKQRIERGPRQLLPSGPIKAVIENQQFSDLQSLRDLGLLIDQPLGSKHTPEPNPVITSTKSVAMTNEGDLDIVIEDVDNS